MSNTPNSSTWSLTKIGLVGSAILLATAVASAFYKGNGSVVNDASVATNGTLGKVAANRSMPASPANPVALPGAVSDASIHLLDGSAKRLADYKGKVVIVDLWATWCGPCRQEIPHLIELADKYKGQGVEVLGLTNEDPTADGERVRQFTQQLKINYPIGFADPQMASSIMQMGGRAGIPQTLVIGRDGRVRNHFVGFSAQISVPQLKAALDEAVAAAS